MLPLDESSQAGLRADAAACADFRLRAWPDLSGSAWLKSQTERALASYLSRFFFARFHVVRLGVGVARLDAKFSDVLLFPKVAVAFRFRDDDVPKAW